MSWGLLIGISIRNILKPTRSLYNFRFKSHGSNSGFHVFLDLDLYDYKTTPISRDHLDYKTTPIRDHLDYKTTPIRDHLDYKTTPIRDHLDYKTTPIRDHLDYKTTPIRDHLDYKTTQKYPNCPFCIIMNLFNKTALVWKKGPSYY